jgi:hypothetical protein
MNTPGFTAEASLVNGITERRFALSMRHAAARGNVLPQGTIGEPTGPVGFAANPPGCYHATGCPNGSPCCTIYQSGGKCYCDRCCVG